MHSLSVRLKTSLTESGIKVPPNIIKTSEKFKEDLKNHAEAMKNEIMDLKQMLEKVPIFSKVANARQSSGSETEATSRYRSLSVEKKSIEVQLHGICEAVAIMQEEVSFVFKSMGFPQEIVPLQYDQSAPLLPPSEVIMEHPASTEGSHEFEADILTQCVQGNAESERTDDILIFQKAAQFSFQVPSLRRSPSGSSKHSRPGDSTGQKSGLVVRKDNVSPTEEDKGSGFRVRKPEESFLWPSMGNSTCLTYSNFQMEDDLSSIQASTTLVFVNLKVGEMAATLTSSHGNRTGISSSLQGIPARNVSNLQILGPEGDSENRQKALLARLLRKSTWSKLKNVFGPSENLGPWMHPQS